MSRLSVVLVALADVAADGRFLMVRGAGGDEGQPGGIVAAEHGP